MDVRRTTMNLDRALVDEAQKLLGTENATTTVHRALEEVVRRFHMSQLLDWDLDSMTNDEIERSDALASETASTSDKPEERAAS